MIRLVGKAGEPALERQIDRKGQVLNNLFFYFPRAANFLRPFLVTAPTIEIVGDRGVTAVGLLRILRYGCCWLYSARFGACPTVKHLRKSSRSFAVAHLVPRYSTGHY